MKNVLSVEWALSIVKSIIAQKESDKKSFKFRFLNVTFPKMNLQLHPVF